MARNYWNYFNLIFTILCFTGADTIPALCFVLTFMRCITASVMRNYFRSVWSHIVYLFAHIPYCLPYCLLTYPFPIPFEQLLVCLFVYLITFCYSLMDWPGWQYLFFFSDFKRYFFEFEREVCIFSKIIFVLAFCLGSSFQMIATNTFDQRFYGELQDLWYKARYAEVSNCKLNRYKL